MCNCFGLQPDPASPPTSLPKNPSKKTANHLDMDDMECRLQALEKFQAKFEAANVLGRLDALEKANAKSAATFDVNNIIRRIERLERNTSKPSTLKDEIERRLEALVELTADGSQELGVEHLDSSFDSNISYSTFSDEIPSDCSQDMTRNSDADHENSVSVPKPTSTLLSLQQVAFAAQENVMNGLLARLQPVEAAQRDNASHMGTVINTMAKVNEAANRLLDLYVIVGHDVSSLSLQVQQQEIELKSGLKQASKQVKAWMCEHHNTTVDIVESRCQMFLETGRVLSMIFTTENEIKETQTELEGVEKTLSAIRAKDKTQKAAAARADLTSRKAELERYLDHLDNQLETLKKKFIRLNKTSDKLP